MIFSFYFSFLELPKPTLVNPPFLLYTMHVHISVFENTLGHVFFLCDSWLFIIHREACMQRKRDISIYFLPVACSPSTTSAPRAPSDHVSLQREGARGVYRGKGSILGVVGLFWVLDRVCISCTSGRHNQEYVLKGDVSCI